MSEFSPIVVVMLVIVCAFVLVMILTIMRWPTIPAYFIAGMVVGPSGIGVLSSGGETGHFIAELGVILLLFTIGLKFSLGSLLPIRRYVFLLGGAQTFITALVFGLPTLYFTNDVLLSLLVGSVVAMSSTAIVSQLLVDENILNSPSGNRSMGVLLFQDLAVIPLIIIFSSGGEESVLYTVAFVVIKVAIIMVIVLYAGGPAMSRWLNLVARYGNKELYMLNLVMIIVLLSGFTAWAGLSYALGAFVAGILMSETLHRYRVLRLVEPFRQIFLGFFFMSLGVLVDVSYLFNNWITVLAVAALVIAVKGPIVYLCVWMLGAHAKTAIFTTLLLCGTGEFGFVLLTLAKGSNLIEDSLFQLVLSANLVALVAIPFGWRQREWLVKKIIGEKEWLVESSKMTANLSQSLAMSGHAVIAGYGRTGQAIAGILRDIEIPYVAVEDNYQILNAVGGADNILYGEATSMEGLMSGGILRARVFIVTYVDPIDSKTAIKRARTMNKDLFIIAKADTVLLGDELVTAGADHVFIDAHEIGLSIAKKMAKGIYKIPEAVVGASISRARKKENLFFTGEFGELTKGDEELPFIGCVARTEFTSLDSVLEGCRVISWQREGKVVDIKDIQQPLQVGDELILSGDRKKMLAVKMHIENVTD
ncbi:MAG: cation:proton antiporter [Gammaproteobacteria bacterium WSBS_2016_MAG_OTU1]